MAEIKRIEPGKLMSRAVVHGNTVYLQGLTAKDRTKDTAGQCKEILDQIDAVLAQAGSDKTKILAAQIWLTDSRNFSAFNEVWTSWISPANTPARATVEARLMHPDLLIEIMVTAAV